MPLVFSLFHTDTSLYVIQYYFKQIPCVLYTTALFEEGFG